jgi:cell division protein FtsL
MRALRKLLWPALFAIVVVGVLFVAVYPAQTYMRQQDELQTKQAQLDDLEAHKADLEARAAALKDDSAVEAMARESYGLVFPGEEAYGIVPAQQPRVVLPDSWPFTELQVRFDRDLS